MSVRRPSSGKRPPVGPSGEGRLNANGNGASYEDLLVAEYLQELKKSPPYTKKGSPQKPSPYEQKLPHTNIVPTPKQIKLLLQDQDERGYRRQRPLSASSSSGVRRPFSATSSLGGRERGSSKPRIDAKFIADPNMWDPATPRSPRTVRIRSRPSSAPIRHSRPTSAVSSKSGFNQRARRIKAQYKKQPKTLVVTAFKNGTRDNFTRVAAPSMKVLLEYCTDKLALGRAARRVFLDDGSEVFRESDIPREAEVYISIGEPYKNPYHTAKQQTMMKKGATWTMNGVMIPEETKKKKSRFKLSKRFKALIDKQKHRIMVFKNGSGTDAVEIVADLDKLDEFLIAVTSKLDLRSYARVLYDWQGKEVWDLHEAPLLDECLQTTTTPILGPVWVSVGEGFSPKGAIQFLESIIQFIQSRLKQAKEYKQQLELKSSGENERIHISAISSMTEEEAEETREMVEKDISDFSQAMSKMRGLYKEMKEPAADEEEEGRAYTLQHIQKIEATDRLVGTQGLKIKVYENGSYDDGQTVFLNLKDAFKGHEDNTEKAMARLLDQITVRHRMTNPAQPAMGVIARRLYKKNGREVKNPWDLMNDYTENDNRELEYWLSFGEPFKDPFTYCLQAVFDKVRGLEMEEGKRVAIREQLLLEDVSDKERAGHWEAYVGFPEDYKWTEVPPNMDPMEREHTMNLLESSEVDVNNHFLQAKDQPNLVLYSEVAVETKKKKGHNDVWPAEAQCWLISKSGHLYSKGIPHMALAVTETMLRCTRGDKEVEGLVVGFQKRMNGVVDQVWRFTPDGYIYCEAQPELVLTYLGGTAHDEESMVENTENRFPGQRVFVAVCEKFAGKDVKSQRWALKQESFSKPGQWKHSEVTNREWNKRAYSWPVKEDGNYNDDFDWPMEGFLIAYAPPLKTTTQNKTPTTAIPIRLTVLKNGERDTKKGTYVVGPDLTNMMRDLDKSAQNGKRHHGHKHSHGGHTHKHGRTLSADKKNIHGSTDSIDNDANLHCWDLTLQELEMQLFFERCTSLIQLPFAARRLFDENGKEHFTLGELKRDQVVYVSCGEPWTDPRLTKAEQQRRYLLAQLSSDLAQIRQFCFLRHPEELVLEIKGKVEVGSQLVTNFSHLAAEQQEDEEAPPPQDENAAAAEEEDEEARRKEEARRQAEEELQRMSAHEKAHMHSEERHEKMKWPWERIMNGGFDEVADANQYTDRSDTYSKQRSKKHHNSQQPPGGHLQHFTLENGWIACKANPSLVLGCQELDGRVTDVIHVKKKPDDILQRWILQENGLIQARQNPSMVLTVKMPTNLRQEDEDMALSYMGCSVSLQPKRTTQFGRANQKWHHDPDTGLIHAFHTDHLDKEITAANKANVCTFAVTKEAIDQPGYVAYLPTGKGTQAEQIVVCTACARAMRGRYKLEKIPTNIDYACAMGNAKSKGLKQVGSFHCLNGKVDLSTFEAHHTLEEWQGQLERLRQETSVRAIAKELSVASAPRTIKIYAYKNGNGRLKAGHLIVGSSVSGMLDQCTHRLEMNKAARRLYTADGMIILDINDLVEWVKDKYVEQVTAERRAVKHEEKRKMKEKAMMERKMQRLQLKDSGREESSEEEDEEEGAGEEKVEGGKQVNGNTENNRLNGTLTEETKKGDSSKPPREQKAGSIEIPSLDELLRYPIEVWASAGEPFAKPKEVEGEYMKSLQNREERAAVAYELEKEKHILRQMQGRRYEEQNPGEYVPTRQSYNPVVIEGHWLDPTAEEQNKHDNVHQLQVHLAEMKAQQKKKKKLCNPKTTKRLYTQPTMKRVLVIPNGESIDRAAHVWGESLQQLLDNATQRLNLRKQATILYTYDGVKIGNFEDVDRDQLLCVSYGKAYQRPRDSIHGVEVKANYSRARKQYGPDATDIVVEAQKNPKIEVDPFGPSALVASAPAIGAASSDNYYPASIQNGEAHKQDGQN